MNNEKSAQPFVSKLSSIVQERVDPKDDGALAAKWNRYMHTLDMIHTQILEKNISGVSLVKNVSTNILDRSGSGDNLEIASTFLLTSSIMYFVIGAMFAGFNYAETGKVDNWMYYVIPIVGLWSAFAGVRIKLRMIENSSQNGDNLPEVIKLSCKPEIHINELEHVHDIVAGIPRMERDPVIYLPALEVSISREWVIQKSVRGVMDKLSNIDLPEDLK